MNTFNTMDTVNTMDPNAVGASVAAVLLILSHLFKQYIPYLKRKYIPLVLLAIGTPLQWYAQGANMDLWSWVGAFIWAAGPTGVYEAAKNAKEVKDG